MYFYAPLAVYVFWISFKRRVFNYCFVYIHHIPHNDHIFNCLHHFLPQNPIDIRFSTSKMEVLLSVVTTSVLQFRCITYEASGFDQLIDCTIIFTCTRMDALGFMCLFYKCLVGPTRPF